MTQVTQAASRPRAEWFWALGSLATGSVYNAMALFGLFYMTTVLGMAPALAGTLLFVTKLYDAITDPIMGAITDRTRHRWGPRRPYLLLGALLLGLSFAGFFNLPSLEGPALVGLVTIALLIYSTGYTVYAVPYLAMPPDIATTYDARTRLMSLRVGFLVIGVMIGSALGPTVVEWAGDGRRGYAVLGMVLGGLAIVSGLIAFFGTASLPTPPRLPRQSQGVGSVLKDAASVFTNRPFRLLTLIKLLQLAVLALALACTPYFFRFVLERSTGDITSYLLTFSIAGLLSLPVWRLVVGRFGKRSVYLVSVVAYGLGLATWYLWTPAEPEWAFYARAVGLGVISNGTLLCALACLPDTMEYDRLVSGTNREGIMSGIFTTVEKIAGALGPLVVGVLLQAMGLVSGQASAADQPESALLAVRLGVSIVPALFCLAAVPLLWAYRLGPKELQAARDVSPSL